MHNIANNIATNIAHYIYTMCATLCSTLRFMSKLHCMLTPANEIIGNLSNHDGNAKENATLKMTSKYLKLFRDSFNSFNLSNVAE